MALFHMYLKAHVSLGGLQQQQQRKGNNASASGGIADAKGTREDRLPRTRQSYRYSSFFGGRHAYSSLAS
jgi:hypothetical protein